MFLAIWRDPLDARGVPKEDAKHNQPPKVQWYPKNNWPPKVQQHPQNNQKDDTQGPWGRANSAGPLLQMEYNSHFFPALVLGTSNLLVLRTGKETNKKGTAFLGSTPESTRKTSQVSVRQEGSWWTEYDKGLGSRMSVPNKEQTKKGKL